MNNVLNNLSIKIKIKIIGNSLILMALIAFSSIFALSSMSRIGIELEAIAEQDIPMTQVMNQSCEQAKSVVDRATLAGASLQTIAESVSRIDAMSTQIATAAEEQSAVAEDMNRNIVRIKDMATQNATGAEQTSQAGNDLAHMASELKEQVEKFRVRDEAVEPTLDNAT